jgi:hypothetical protein
MTRSRNCSKQLIIICEIAATIAAVRMLPHKFAHNYGTRLWRERGSGLLSSCLYQVYRSRADPSLQTHSFAMIQLKIRCKSCGIVARSHDIENSCSFPTSPTCSTTDVASSHLVPVRSARRLPFNDHQQTNVEMLFLVQVRVKFVSERAI